MSVYYTIESTLRPGEKHELEAKSDEEEMIDDIVSALGPLPDVETLPDGDFCEFKIVSVDSDEPEPRWAYGIPTLSQLAAYVEFLEAWKRKGMLAPALAALAYHGDLSYAADSVKDQFIGAFKAVEDLGIYLIEEHREHCIPCDLYRFFDFAKYAKDQDLIIEQGNDRLWYAFFS